MITTLLEKWKQMWETPADDHERMLLQRRTCAMRVYARNPDSIRIRKYWIRCCVDAQNYRRRNLFEKQQGYGWAGR